MPTATTNPPLGITPPPAPSVPDINQFIDIASKQISPGFNDVLAATQNKGQVAADNAKNTVAGLQGSQTIIQKQYGDLANEFKVEEGIETDQAKQIGEANVGSAEVAMAKSGIDQSAQGSFAAPKAQAQASLQQSIAQIADKYGAKQEQIESTLTASVQDINNQIIQAQNSGNAALADSLSEVAQLKYGQQQQIISLAQQMQSAQTQAEQDAWKDYMDEVSAQHQQATLDLMSARLVDSEQKTQTSNDLELAKQGAYTGKDPQLVAVNNKSRTATQQGYTKSLNDYASKVAVQAGQTGISREEIIKQLQNDFPDLDPESIADDVYNQYPDTYTK